jgi:hypothetical protein
MQSTPRNAVPSVERDVPASTSARNQSTTSTPRIGSAVRPVVAHQRANCRNFDA